MSTNTTKEFARRLNQACDDSQNIPEHGKGRQVVIANKMKVTQEAVRKWFDGESIPRPPKMKALATFLGVDHAWLALGIKPEMTREDLQRANRRSSGSVYLVTGLIMLEGGNCAWPSPNDSRGEYVDIYAIMRGVQTALHVSTGTPLATDEFEFMVPREYEDVHCVGVVTLGPGKYHLVDLPGPMISKHKEVKAGGLAVKVKWVNSHYVTDGDTWPRLKMLGEIL